MKQLFIPVLVAIIVSGCTGQYQFGLGNLNDKNDINPSGGRG